MAPPRRFAFVALHGLALGGALALPLAACSDVRRPARDVGLAPAPAGAPRATGGQGAGAADGGDLGAGGDDEGDAGAPAPTPWSREVLYLVMPDRFSNGDPKNDNLGEAGCLDPSKPALFHGGDIAGLRQRIPYLAELGVSALWTTPLTKQVPLRNGACGYHGYWADFVDPDEGAVEPKLGTLQEAQGLLADLHAAGMKLMLDLVVNHGGRGARIVAQHPGWFHDASTCAGLGPSDVYCPLNGLPDFAQEDPEVAAYLTAMSRGWLARIPADGIRMDTAKHVPLAYFAKDWGPAVRAQVPGLFLLAEDFDEGGASKALPFLDAGFDSTFDFGLRRALSNSLAKGGSLNEVADRVRDSLRTLGLSRALARVLFLDNHDLPRFLAEALPSMGADELQARYELALVALFTLPGIPQVYMGDELGALAVAPDHRRDMPPWAWTAEGRGAQVSPPGYVKRPARAFDLLKQLARLRRTEVALGAGRYGEVFRPGAAGPNLLAFARVSRDSRVLVVIYDGPPASPVSLSLEGLPPSSGDGALIAADGAALARGALVDVLNRGAPPSLVFADGRVDLPLPGRFAGVYIARN